MTTILYFPVNHCQRFKNHGYPRANKRSWVTFCLLRYMQKGGLPGSKKCNRRQKKGPNPSEWMKEMSKRLEASDNQIVPCKGLLLGWCQGLMGGGFSFLVILKLMVDFITHGLLEWIRCGTFPFLKKISEISIMWMSSLFWSHTDIQGSQERQLVDHAAPEGVGGGWGPSACLPSGFAFHDSSSLRGPAALLKTLFCPCDNSPHLFHFVLWLGSARYSHNSLAKAWRLHAYPHPSVYSSSPDLVPFSRCDDEFYWFTHTLLSRLLGAQAMHVMHACGEGTRIFWVRNPSAHSTATTRTLSIHWPVVWGETLIFSI